MLVGRDLGFPYFLLVVVVIVPAIGFIVRRKWRHAVARREEIRRLLVLASEEAARAELEASEGYYYTTTTTETVPAPVAVPSVPSLKSQYQCAVCFSPTTTRCAQCKAVRYCSGRCQIIHWRQGHKEECRPYVPVNPINAVGRSCKQGDDKDYSGSSNTVGQQTAKPNGRFPEGLHDEDEVVFESVAHQKGTNSTVKSASDSSYEGYSSLSANRKSSIDSSSSDSRGGDRVRVRQFADVNFDNFEATKSEYPSLINPVKRSGKINQDESNRSDEDTNSGSSSSSSRTDDGSTLSEPAMPSSGFWDGTIHSKKIGIDELDDTAPSSSSKAANAQMADFQSSLKFSFDATKIGVSSTVMKGSTVNSIISEENGSPAYGCKASNDEITPPKEMSSDGLMYKRPPTATAEKSKHRDADVGSDLPKALCKESTSSLSGASSHRANAAGVSTLKDVKIPVSSSPDRLNHAFNNKNVASLTSKSLEVGSSVSKTSDVHMTSSSSKHVSHVTKAVKVNDDNHRVVASSSQLTENSQSSRSGLKTSMLKVVDQLKPSNLSRNCSPGKGNETAHRYNCKGLFSYDLFVKLYNWKKDEFQPCGLVNCGNSCYANAVLQCLAFTPPLTAYLLQKLHSKTCDKRGWCFTCEFESLVLKAKDGNSPLSPIRILSQIENIGRNLGHGREEDAHEFLRYAIDTLQSVCLKEAGIHSSGSLEEETTLIGLTFGGYLRSKIKCMKCGGKSEQHERMMDLTVEIEGDIGTLEEALNKFTRTELLDGENKYKCGRCKSYEKAKKKLTLLEAPNVLTIALKRFQSGKFGKLNKPIYFPEILDVAPYMSGTSDKSPIYRLYGVVVHVDVMNAAFSGHYVCYVKNVQNRWFKIDDSMVKEVDLPSVLTKGAYMLLYARCSPRAPRSIRGSLIHHDPRKHKTMTTLKSRSHSTEPWDVCGDHPSSGTQVRHRSLEEESSSSSDNSSGFFSESCSCSTESSHRDSSSIEDQNFGDWEQDYFNSSSPSWRNMNSSDSDTSSSSSYPSPLYSRHSPLYTSRTSGASQVDNETYEQWSRERSRSCKSAGVLYCDEDHMTSKECRNVGLSSSSSCRETNLDRLGGRGTNPFESSKPGVTLRRSTTRGRSD